MVCASQIDNPIDSSYLTAYSVGIDYYLELTLQLLIDFRVFNLLLALWASKKYLAGPEGQQKISSWTIGPPKDLLQPEAAHNMLWPKATTS